jgi:hypothetical protein
MRKTLRRSEMRVACNPQNPQAFWKNRPAALHHGAAGWFGHALPRISQPVMGRKGGCHVARQTAAIAA